MQHRLPCWPAISRQLCDTRAAPTSLVGLCMLGSNTASVSVPTGQGTFVTLPRSPCCTPAAARTRFPARSIPRHNFDHHRLVLTLTSQFTHKQWYNCRHGSSAYSSPPDSLPHCPASGVVASCVLSHPRVAASSPWGRKLAGTTHIQLTAYQGPALGTQGTQACATLLLGGNLARCNLQHCQEESPHSRSMHSRVATKGYVGDGSKTAGEYHDSDFDWYEHAQQVEQQLHVQRSSNQAAAQQMQQPQQKHLNVQHDQACTAQQEQQAQPSQSVDIRMPVRDMVHAGMQQPTNSHQRSGCTTPAPSITSILRTQHGKLESSIAAADLDSVKLTSGTGADWQQQYDPQSWERFHAKDNATARFYKERR